MENKSTSDYRHLDGRLALKKFYTQGHNLKKETLLACTEFLQKRNKTGRNFLEIGTGPSIHTVITPAKFYDNITITYYAQNEGDLAMKWCQGDNSVFDWSKWVEMVLKKEDPSERVINEKQINERIELIRYKIKDILPCDIGNHHIIPTSDGVLYDTICSSGCLECACKSYDEYYRAAEQFSELLVSGGLLLLFGAIQGSFYEVNQKFAVLSLSEAQIEDAFRNAGFSKFTWYITEKKSCSPIDVDVKAYFFMSAVKISE